jgi:cellobiose phosphorylase
MFAYSLFKRGYAQEAWQVLQSIYEMAINTGVSKIYPCLPEYFNLEGRGMYSYLTGSASWFVLTILTEGFGLKGKDGDLLIEPKLSAEQFRGTRQITVKRQFAGRNLQVNFLNPQRLPWPKYRIIKARLNSVDFPLQEPQNILIRRRAILNLPAHKINTIDIILG